MKKEGATNATIAVFIVIVLAIIAISFLTGCDVVYDGTYIDTENTKDIAANLQTRQPTPTDIDYSLERYNLIRRTYWVNGMREKANSLPCEVEKPLGYIILIAGNKVLYNFVVDGKVSSLNSFLTPDSEYYERANDGYRNEWLADVDGSYGENDAGIFFFTPNGKYIEWTGDYLYSDIPFEIEDAVLNYTGG